MDAFALQAYLEENVTNGFAGLTITVDTDAYTVTVTNTNTDATATRKILSAVGIRQLLSEMLTPVIGSNHVADVSIEGVPLVAYATFQPAE